jgi:patatin-like phospholipase
MSTVEHSARVTLVALLLLLGWAAPQAGARQPGIQSAPAVEWSGQAQKKKKPPPKKGQAAPKQPSIPPREPFTLQDQQRAVVAGIPDARFWADSESEYARALPATPGPWLILSTGGSDGAFGAGLLNGLTQTGRRPEFSLVTGVSTGALIAPYAFLGPKYDDALRDAYTTIGAIDIFEIGGKGESLLDTWPLRDTMTKRVTPELLAAIAAEHARGRRLFVVTTNLDAGRPVAWDMGAIASKGGEQAVRLFREVLIASISIPGAFPPVMIEAEADGKRFHEMHADGGLGAQFYVAPETQQTSTSTVKLPATALYIIVNMKLTADFYPTERSLISILGRAVDTAIKVVTSAAIDRAYVIAKRSGIPFNLAYVDSAFYAPSRGAFDSDYMKALYEFGVARGSSAEPFRSEPPDNLSRPTKAAQ